MTQLTDIAIGILAAGTVGLWAFIGYELYRIAEYQATIEARLATIARPTVRRIYTYAQHLASL